MKPKTAFDAATGGTSDVSFSVFRETFLCTLDEYGATVCREFGEVLGERFMERAVVGVETPSVPLTVAEFTGATKDLGFIAKFLRDVAAERTLSELTPTEQQLSEFAAEMAPKIEGLAEVMRSALEILTSDDSGIEPAG